MKATRAFRSMARLRMDMYLTPATLNSMTSSPLRLGSRRTMTNRAQLPPWMNTVGEFSNCALQMMETRPDAVKEEHIIVSPSSLVSRPQVIQFAAVLFPRMDPFPIGHWTHILVTVESGSNVAIYIHSQLQPLWNATDVVTDPAPIFRTRAAGEATTGNGLFIGGLPTCGSTCMIVECGLG